MQLREVAFNSAATLCWGSVQAYKPESWVLNALAIKGR